MTKQTTPRNRKPDRTAALEAGLIRPPDMPSRTDGREQRKLRYELRLHPQVSDDVRSWRHLYERLGIILQQLAAHGRTSVVKGCRNQNVGWLRSPLGGHGGLQYYLWWAPGTSRQVRGLRLPEQSIVVRTVRHHDEHAALRAGRLKDYLTLTTNDDLSEDVAGEPWTDHQYEFRDDTSVVRILQGQPGCGKTTALWQAVDARENENVLYLTWSTALARQSAEHFDSLAPSSMNVRTIDFTSLVAILAGTDLERITLETSRKRFEEKIQSLRLERPAEFKNGTTALYTEIRAEMLGQARPASDNERREEYYRTAREDHYRTRRAKVTGLNSKTLRYILHIAKHLDNSAIRHIFPELWGANIAWSELYNGNAPAEFLDIDRIVIDEVQDLTLVEILIITELCKLIGKHKKRQPYLLIAGDTGQTVRPSAFSWAGLSKVVEHVLSTTPKSFPVDEHVRSPRRIAETVEKAADAYLDVDKAYRPTKQYRQQHEEQLEGQLIHVVIETTEEANTLIRELAQGDDVAVLNAWREKPEWLSPDLNASVLTPEEAKGLEYQTVCILNPGIVLLALMKTRNNNDIGTIFQETHRNTVDQFRVALSRATETLVLIDVEASEAMQHLSRGLLMHPATYSSADLLEHLRNETAPPEERVLTRTRDARALIDAAPERAWQRACQATHLLGSPGIPNGIQDIEIRNAARRAMLETGARLLVTKVFQDPEANAVLAARILHEAENASDTELKDRPKRDDSDQPPDEEPDRDSNTRQSLFERIKRATLGGKPSEREKTEAQIHHTYSVELEEHAIVDLGDWIEEREPPINLLENARLMQLERSAAENWLQPNLNTIAQTLRKDLENGAANLKWAPFYVKSDVSAWLRITGQSATVETTARELVETAFDTLVTAATQEPEGATERDSFLMKADRLLNDLKNDYRRLGRFHEALGEKERAIAAYIEADAHQDGRRVWRTVAQWERARTGASGNEETDLEWLLKVEHLSEDRPGGIDKRLHKAEHERLRKLATTIGGSPPQAEDR